MITLEITAMERIYFPKENNVGELVEVYQEKKRSYSARIQADEEGRKYVEIPMTQIIEVPRLNNAKKVAVYEDDKLLLRREIK